METGIWIEEVTEEKAIVAFIKLTYEKAKLEEAQKICKQMAANIKAAKEICHQPVALQP